MTNDKIFTCVKRWLCGNFVCSLAGGGGLIVLGIVFCHAPWNIGIAFCGIGVGMILGTTITFYDWCEVGRRVIEEADKP